MSGTGPVPDPQNFWRCWICGEGGSPADGWRKHHDANHGVDEEIKQQIARAIEASDDEILADLVEAGGRLEQSYMRNAAAVLALPAVRAALDAQAAAGRVRERVAWHASVGERYTASGTDIADDFRRALDGTTP